MADLFPQNRRSIQEHSISIVQDAVAAVVDGQIEMGARLLQKLDAEALEAIYYARLAESRHAIPVKGKKNSGPSGPSKKQIFIRDKYRCRYCGTRTIDEDVWPAIDRADPCHAVLGWDKNWPKGITHWIVWALTASDDQVEPKAAGGPDYLGNRVCACYPCQQAKSSRRLEDLQAIPGWRLLEIDSSSSWDGLSNQVFALEASSTNYNNDNRMQKTRVHKDDQGRLIPASKIQVGSLIHFGQKGRFVIDSIDSDGTFFSFGLRNAVGQRNGRWKVSKTTRIKRNPGPIYVVTSLGPKYDDPCD